MKPIVKMENVVAGIKKLLPECYHHLVPMNEKAIMRGIEIFKEVQKAK